MIIKMFVCDKCIYKTINKSSFIKHQNSKKHQKLVSIESETICDIYNCKKCSKPYFSYSGLWSHKKKCELVNTNIVFYSENPIVLSPSSSALKEIIKRFYITKPIQPINISKQKEKIKNLNNKFNTIYNNIQQIIS